MADRNPAILIAVVLIAWAAACAAGYHWPPQCPKDPACAYGLPREPAPIDE